MQADVFGGVWIPGIIFMIHIPQVHRPPRLSSILLTAARLGARKDVQDLRCRTAQVFLDLYDLPRVFLGLVSFGHMQHSHWLWKSNFDPNSDFSGESSRNASNFGHIGVLDWKLNFYLFSYLNHFSSLKILDQIYWKYPLCVHHTRQRDRDARIIGYQGGSRERTLPIYGPLLITLECNEEVTIPSF